jgi:hypothetical protein
VRAYRTLTGFSATRVTVPNPASVASRRISRSERRELAHRTNDGIDVTLFWSKACNRVTISVFHARSTTTLEFEVDGADALDAFNHPYAYAATEGAHYLPTPHGVPSQ